MMNQQALEQNPKEFNFENRDSINLKKKNNAKSGENYMSAMNQQVDSLKI